MDFSQQVPGSNSVQSSQDALNNIQLPQPEWGTAFGRGGSSVANMHAKMYGLRDQRTQMSNEQIELNKFKEDVARYPDMPIIDACDYNNGNQAKNNDFESLQTVNPNPAYGTSGFSRVYPRLKNARTIQLRL